MLITSEETLTEETWHDISRDNSDYYNNDSNENNEMTSASVYAAIGPSK